MKRRVLLALAAGLGIAFSAAVAWSATRLASQHIGLSNEPLSVAAGLAPARATAPATHRPANGKKTAPRRGRRTHGGAGRPSVSTPPPAVAPAPAPPVSSLPNTTSPPAPAQPATTTPTAARPAKPAQRQRDDSGGGGRSGGSGDTRRPQGPDD
ncbi:MAG TPA: hypothetical protein VKR21_00765 [Solirubrobacteraceae bacterium]|nr:hypothetical protein [Solirubrobacteraceae bacterium]